MKQRLKTYYLLTKPGIIRGNALAATAGYLFATKFHPHLMEYLAMLTGLSLIIACGCVLNNYIDRDIDSRMERTKQRALVSGEVSVRAAIIYAIVLGIAGTLALAYGTNILTTWVALFGLFAYVVIYGVGKRTTVHGTLIGSISGAVPPVVGYVAAANQLDAAAALLFLVLVAWQMPHFYGIAMYRAKDYKAAKIPVMPNIYGMKSTKIQTLVYILMLATTSILLTVKGYVGYSYLAIMGALCLHWFYIGAKTFKTTDNAKWGKTMFLYSLIVLSVWSILLPLGTILP